jgi:hypothetical protein
VRREAARLWHATANPDGNGVLLRGMEFRPVLRHDVKRDVLESVLRVARLSAEVAEALRDHPDVRVRRSAAVLAARAYPVRAAFDD